MKIYIHPHSDYKFGDWTSKEFKIYWICPRTELMIKEGLEQIPEIELVDNILSADFIIWHHVPQYNGHKDFRLINRIDSKKLVIIDSIDEHNEYFVEHLNPYNYFLYFKRSIVKTDHLGNRTPITLLDRQFPWDYGILNGFKQRLDVPRKINIGVYLRPSCSFRSAVLYAMQRYPLPKINDKWPIVVNQPVSQGSRSIGKDVYFDPTYFDYLRRTQIVVSSGPFGWIGDSRGAEAIANTCLYFSNELWDYMPNPMIPHQHWVKFDPFNDEHLYTLLDYYLNNPKLIKGVAQDGRDHAMQWHTSKARMQYVIDKIKEYR